MRFSALMIVAVLLAATGCRHLAADDDLAALLVNPSDITRTELRNALQAALGGVPVTIADNALVSSSLLIIDRAAPRGGEARALTGRTVETTAQRFQLVINNNECVLVRSADASRTPLPSAQCAAE